MPESGCCGMAGAFGYEEGSHYDVSIKAGERVLLPKVRQTPDDHIIIAGGFSCRKQIQQETDHRAMHMAEVMQMALRHGPIGQSGRPEAQMLRERKKEFARAAMTTGAYLSIGAVAAALIAWKLHQRHASSPYR